MAVPLEMALGFWGQKGNLAKARGAGLDHMGRNRSLGLKLDLQAPVLPAMEWRWLQDRWMRRIGPAISQLREHLTYAAFVAPLAQRRAIKRQSAPDSERAKSLDLFRLVTDLIDLRSFSNMWYWIVLAAVWSMTSHWVLGARYDLIARAHKKGGQDAQDLETIVDINVRGLLGVTRTAAVPLFFCLSFFYSVLTLLAFRYGIEFAQALFFLLAPLVVVGWLRLRTALAIEQDGLRGAALCQKLITHRRIVQSIGMLAIFVTGIFGMWRNLTHSILTHSSLN